VTAFSTLVLIGVELSDPLLDTGSGEFQINQRATSLIDLLDTLLAASWTSFAFVVDDAVGVSLRAFQSSMPLIDDPELTMRSYKHLFTLVIKVGTFVDALEIFQSVFFRPKQLATCLFLNHLLGVSNRGKTPWSCRDSGIR
jgi:hypothetical protein